MRRLAVFGCALAATLAPGAPHAAGVDAQVVAVVQGLGPGQYLGEVSSLPQGSARALMTTGAGGTFTNADTFLHDVVADALDSSGVPLFHTGSLATTTLVAPGGSVPINGVDTLPAGSYAFHCSIHSWMRGILTVEDPPA
ncbi:MAG: cupredoxin domain-containing protein [Candidatus Dormibacteria bacterium]